MRGNFFENILEDLAEGFAKGLFRGVLRLTSLPFRWVLLLSAPVHLRKPLGGWVLLVAMAGLWLGLFAFAANGYKLLPHGEYYPFLEWLNTLTIIKQIQSALALWSYAWAAWYAFFISAAVAGGDLWVGD